VIRVLLDTNVWISAFLSPRGHCRQVVESLRLVGARLISSAALLEELSDVLRREKLRAKYGYAPEEAERYFELVREAVTESVPRDAGAACRDARDRTVLEAAVGGSVDYLVTRDDDLKRDPELIEELDRRGIRVVSISQIREILKLSGT
jgi:putative PIN family toxin of toxin-antitoxin system